MSISQEQEFFIQWHLTERCNLRCSHCYQAGGRSDELGFSEVEDVIKEVSVMLRAWTGEYGISFSPGFNITGGEPLLRKDLFAVLDSVGSSGFDAFLLTNGTLVTSEKAKQLAALAVKGVQVSIEGPEAIHDSIRGKGSFSAAIKGIRHLLDAGLPVTMNATLSGINAAHFIDMVGLAVSLGVQRLGFSRLVPSGRGRGLIDRMMPADRVAEVYREIFSFSGDGLDIVTGDPIASQMSVADDGDSGPVARSGCAAAISGLTFLPDGAIVPCRRLFIPIGNVRTDSIREVWASSPVLDALRDRSGYKGKCGSCGRWADCRGCRAIAYAYSCSKGKDDFLAEDPQCFIG